MIPSMVALGLVSDAFTWRKRALGLGICEPLLSLRGADQGLQVLSGRRLLPERTVSEVVPVAFHRTLPHRATDDASKTADSHVPLAPAASNLYILPTLAVATSVALP